MKAMTLFPKRVLAALLLMTAAGAVAQPAQPAQPTESRFEAGSLARNGLRSRIVKLDEVIRRLDLQLNQLTWKVYLDYAEQTRITPKVFSLPGLNYARLRDTVPAIDRLGKRLRAASEAYTAILRTDPQFYAKTPQQLLDRAAWISKRVDGEVGKFIGTLPRGRFTIVEVPADIAPFWTAGRGGLGTYWLNTYDLPSRPLYNLPALTLHESSPGHSLQAALAQEQGEQPAFRRDNYISAYGEGWALYTEKLGKEMGIYETPYEDFGRLTYEMWRAARLVIDTGVHHKGWSRDQALAYLRDHTALSEHEVTTEVDRYISWPGQALSYKLGEIAIVRLRAEAERELGPKFDIKAFHDAVLKQGSVTLPVLESQIRAFIAASKAGPAKAAAAAP